MTVKSQHLGTNQAYIVTFTCYKWISLFDITNSYSFIEDWLIRLVGNGNQVTGYVIMPNHIHLLLYMNEGSQTIDRMIEEGKRFMAYHIVKQLKKLDSQDILEQLKNGVENNERENGKLHNVFEASFDAKPIYTDKFAEQKLEYIHYNPIRWKWNLAKLLEDCAYSSAKYHFTGQQNRAPVTHYREAGIFETKEK